MTISIIGTLVNAAAVLLGGIIGLLLKGRIPEERTKSIVRTIGLCVCVIGIADAIKGDLMLVVVSLALGTLVGEIVRLDAGLNNMGERLQKIMSQKEEKSAFAEGFVTATILFCVGAMSIIGSIESGLGDDRSMIYTKSILDGISAMVFASYLGFGVLFSAVVILVYQGSIELFAGSLQNILQESSALMTHFSATGGVMVLAIGLNMTLHAQIKVANMLPSLFFAVGYYYLLLNESVSSTL